MAKRLRAIACLFLFGAAATASADGMRVREADRRGEEQTYLTFPEWFLVFSPAEYAAMLRDRRPSEFPFFGHIGQFWGSYARIIGATRKYPVNAEYHTMIGVIGVSTTAEYGIKGAYETLIGRLTELTVPDSGTREDLLAARQAQDYVDFIRVRPWYEFDFVSPLKELWTRTPWWGTYPLRKWERRYALTSEWAAKAVYAALLETATRSAFALPTEQTAAIVGKPGQEMQIALQRYQAFTDGAVRLAAQGVPFIEIAGNRDVILVSLLAPKGVAPPPGTRLFLRQPVNSPPGRERQVLEVPVANLSATLVVARNSGTFVEHVFDY